MREEQGGDMAAMPTTQAWGLGQGWQGRRVSLEKNSIEQELLRCAEPMGQRWRPKLELSPLNENTQGSGCEIVKEKTRAPSTTLT